MRKGFRADSSFLFIRTILSTKFERNLSGTSDTPAGNCLYDFKRQHEQQDKLSFSAESAKKAKLAFGPFPFL